MKRLQISRVLAVMMMIVIGSYGHLRGAMEVTSTPAPIQSELPSKVGELSNNNCKCVCNGVITIGKLTDGICGCKCNTVSGQDGKGGRGGNGGVGGSAGQSAGQNGGSGGGGGE